MNQISEQLALLGLLTSHVTLIYYADSGPSRFDPRSFSRFLRDPERNQVSEAVSEDSLLTMINRIHVTNGVRDDLWWRGLQFLINQHHSPGDKAILQPRFPMELLPQSDGKSQLPQSLKKLPAWDLHVHLGSAVSFEIIWLAVMARAIPAIGWRSIDEEGTPHPHDFPPEHHRISELIEQCRQKIENSEIANEVGLNDSLNRLKQEWGQPNNEYDAVRDVKTRIAQWFATCLEKKTDLDEIRSYIIRAGVCRRALVSYFETQDKGLDPFRESFKKANKYRKIGFYKARRKSRILFGKTEDPRRWRHEVSLLTEACYQAEFRWQRRLMRLALQQANDQGMDGLELRTSLDKPIHRIPSQVRALARGVIDAAEMVPESQLRMGLLVCFKKGTRTSNRQQIASDADEVAKNLVRLLRRDPRWTNFIRGVDAAESEIGSSPIEFVFAFRTIDEWNQNLPPGGHRLGRTFHAGEDFESHLGGLRYIDEAIDVLLLRRGDRIGHGSALGRQPQLGEIEETMLGEYLENLNWIVLPRVDHDSDLVTTWGNIPIKVPKNTTFSCKHEVVISRSLHQRIEQRRAELIQKVRSLGIALESCPTSNLVIRQLHSYAEVPFWGLARAKLKVTVNTDNPGIFAVSWHDEVNRLIQEQPEQEDHLIREALYQAPKVTFIDKEITIVDLKDILKNLL